jgi:hypothetical protein
MGRVGHAKPRKMVRLVCIAFALGACGSTASTGGADESPAPLDLEDGFARVSIPLTPRQDPLLVVAGDDVFVYGGFVVPGQPPGETLEPKGDGASYNLVKGEWRELPTAPFSRALYRPSGVWTGTEVLVLGTPCGPTSTESDRAVCTPAGVEMAAYSPAKNTWRIIEGVEGPKGAALALGFPLSSSGLGWTGSEAVFAVSSQRSDQGMLLVDPVAGKSHWAPALENTDATCVTGDNVVAVRTGQISQGGGSSSPNPEAVAQPLRTFELDAAAARWNQVAETVKPASAGAMFEQVHCSGGRLTYLPVMPPPTGFAAGALRWNGSQKRWNALPSFGGIGFPGGVVAVEASGTLVIWILNHDTLFLLRPGATAWTTTPKPPSAREPMKLHTTRGLVIVNETAGQLPLTPLSFGVLDLDRLMPSRG